PGGARRAEVARGRLRHPDDTRHGRSSVLQRHGQRGLPGQLPAGPPPASAARDARLSCQRGWSAPLGQTRMCPARPDWQLPPGVNRGAWDYIRSPGIARTYDAGLADSSLFRLDLAFFDEYALPALTQPGSPGRLLDLGCGTGRLLIHAARRGFWCL